MDKCINCLTYLLTHVLLIFDRNSTSDAVGIRLYGDAGFSNSGCGDGFQVQRVSTGTNHCTVQSVRGAGQRLHFASTHRHHTGDQLRGVRRSSASSHALADQHPAGGHSHLRHAHRSVRHHLHHHHHHHHRGFSCVSIHSRWGRGSMQCDSTMHYCMACLKGC